MDVLNEICDEQKKIICTSEPLMKALTNSIDEIEEIEVKKCWEELEKAKEISKNSDSSERLMSIRGQAI